MQKTPLVKKIEKLISPTVDAMGFELVRILLVGSGRPTLQIMAERPDGTMGMEDCGKLSQALSAILDVENAVDGAYHLEVSSPGIDRPLTRIKDFENNIGFDARVEMDTPINGQKKFKGKITGVDKNTGVQLETPEGQAHTLPFDDILKAKLLLTDALIKTVQQRNES